MRGILAVGLLFAVSWNSALADVSGEKPTGIDLTNKSVEELMNIEVVSVTQRRQTMARTAASVYVITQEDIRRSGFTSIPELLRLAPGVEVARIDVSSWAISIRGLNDQYRRKVLVVIDGRAVYNDISTGVQWGALDMLLDNIERIEIIRGPGTAMWGANAMNGVINIVTKSTEATLGGVAIIQAGTEEKILYGGRFGGRVGDNLTYRVYHKLGDRPPYATEQGFRPDRNSVDANAGIRADWNPSRRDSFLFEGDAFRQRNGKLALTFEPDRPLGYFVQDHADGWGGNLLGRWNRELSDRSSVQVQTFYEGNASQGFIGKTRLQTFDAEVQHYFAGLPRQEIVWGGGYRVSDHHAEGGGNFYPTRNRIITNLYSFFAQDEITLVPGRLYAIAGVRIEHNTFTGFEIQPSVRLDWEPNPNYSAWTAISHADSPPTVVQDSYNLTVGSFLSNSTTGQLRTNLLLQGNPKMRPEELLSYEVGQRVRPHKSLSLDLSLFYNHYLDLQMVKSTGYRFVPTPVPHALLEGLFFNGRSGVTYGGELSAQYKATKNWKFSAGYSLYRASLHPDPAIPSLNDSYNRGKDPAHQIQLRTGLDLPKRFEFDMAMYYTSALTGPGIGPRWRGDVRMGWHPSSKVELSLGTQDIFDPRHAEFSSAGMPPKFQMRRNLFSKVVWRF